ncbi:hypothetical protein HJD18_15880 [Thermoleophilia bacterium SCSIO 60948]|nr:hypothetical protein HJD18_15880 [Thermoleophilia bacterium SCSIO 60948]
MRPSPRRFSPVAAIALVAALGLLLTGSALAAVFDGQTRQDRKVKLRTAGDDPKRFAIHFRAPCRRSDEVLRADTVLQPLNGGKSGFRSKERYREELTRGFTGRIRTSVAGRKASAKRWTGRFTVRALIVKDGEVRDKCILENLPWRVSR